MGPWKYCDPTQCKRFIQDYNLIFILGEKIRDKCSVSTQYSQFLQRSQGSDLWCQESLERWIRQISIQWQVTDIIMRRTALLSTERERKMIQNFLFQEQHSLSEFEESEEHCLSSTFFLRDSLLPFQKKNRKLIGLRICSPQFYILKTICMFSFPRRNFVNSLVSQLETRVKSNK